MARISPASPVASPSDQLDAELGQLLKRLQHSILYVDADREHALRTNDIERERAERNLAYARSVLTRLEQESMGLRAHILKQDVQCDLNQRRESLEVLMDRMRDLSKVEAEEEEDDDGETDSQDDILADIIPTPSESMDSRSADHSHDPGEQDDISSAEAQQATPANPTPTSEPSGTQAPTTEPASAPIYISPPPATPDTTSTEPLTAPAHAPTPTTTTTQAVRPRRNLQHRPSSRAALLSRKASATPHTQSATTEALLDRERVDQDSLIEGILGYASALKDSTQRFHDSLDKDRGAMERAAEGVERAGTGMEGTRKLLGTLQRMTEGKGWWGRMGLYAWVYGLMVFLVFMVFTFPKLRF